jgi:hypothetical protein
VREVQKLNPLDALGRRRLLKGVAAGSILASGVGAVIFDAHNGNRGVAPQIQECSHQVELI